MLLFLLVVFSLAAIEPRVLVSAHGCTQNVRSLSAMTIGYIWHPTPAAMALSQREPWLGLGESVAMFLGLESFRGVLELIPGVDPGVRTA